MRRVVAFLAVIFATGTSAYAYVPPSGFVIKTLALKHAGVKGVRVRGVVSDVENGKPGIVRFKHVTLYDPLTGILRSRAYDDADRELYAVERKAEDLRLSDALLLDAKPEAVIADLVAAKIPVRSEAELARLKDEPERWAAEQSFIARWNGGLAWVIGEKGSLPQLWLEKDTFVPARLVTSNADIRYERFRYHREYPYPRVITLFAGDNPELVDTMTEFETGPNKAEWKPVTPGFTDVGNSAPGGVRDLIRKYYETLR